MGEKNDNKQQTTLKNDFLAPLSCPICASHHMQVIYEKEGVPIFAHKIDKNPTKAAQAAVGQLQLVYCQECGFIFNAAFEKERVVYDGTYDNSQDYSLAFHAHQAEVEKFITDTINLKQQHILEIGCGKGGFLQQLTDNNDGFGTGFDPSYQPNAAEENARLQIFAEYFGQASYSKITKPVKLVLWRHVIEHIDNPKQALKDITDLFSDDEDYYLYIETPDAQWIMENHMVYDFVYEHCALFTLRAIEKLLDEAGLTIIKYQKMFHEQYLAVLAKPKKSQRMAASTKSFWQDEEKAAKQYLKALKNAGAVCIWGAGAKGIMFCNLFDEHREWIDCLIDINPHKQGAFAARTAHPIVCPKHLENYAAGHVLVLNSNYLQEITEDVKNINPQLAVIDFEAYLTKNQMEKKS